MPTYSFKVNGKAVRVTAPAGMALLWVLRDKLGITGPKYGCGMNVCKACTCLVNGSAVTACSTTVSSVQGAEVTTIEGLARDGNLHPVQEGFWECHGLQCGYCTPGMILAGVDLLNHNPKPTREEICHGLEGNLCRCTGYSHIIDAVQWAAKKMARAEKR